MSIIPAYIAGNWSEIETTAEKIKSSYILKQSLTESHVKELHSVSHMILLKKIKDFIIWQVCLNMPQKVENQS